MFGIRIASAIAAMSVTVGSAAAFEYSVRSSIPDAELSNACTQALIGYNAPLASNYCRSLSGQTLMSEIENKSYELLGDANSLMPLGSYFLTHKRTYSDSTTSPEGRRANAEWKANALTLREGDWIAPSKGQYLDLNALSQLGVTSELVRADFGTRKEQKNGSYTNWVLGFTAGSTDYKYDQHKFGADLHYRYSVSWNGRKIYDGFIVRHMPIGIGIACPTRDSNALEDCNSLEGGNRHGGTNFFKPDVRPSRAAIDLITMESSPFSDMVGFSGRYRITDPLTAKYADTSYNVKTAQRPDLPQYATSFSLIEGGRAKFGYRQLAIYTAAQQNAQVAAGGTGGETARFLADQQYCAQYAKSSIQEDRAFRSGLGALAGVAGFGQAASAINTASSISTIAEGLNGEELNVANNCMQDRGHSGIDSALAADSGPANSAYVPYTAGASAAPAATATPTQSYQGSASAYGATQAPVRAAPVASTPPVAQATGSASAYQAPSAATASTLPANAEGNSDAIPIKRIPPIFPPRFLQGNHSGYCRVEFDVSPTGQTENARLLACTSEVLTRASLNAVQEWVYEPKRVNGVAVTRKNVVSKITFRLSDSNGNLLPEPATIYNYREPSTDTDVSGPSAPVELADPTESGPSIPPTIVKNIRVLDQNLTDLECSNSYDEVVEERYVATGSCVRIDIVLTNNNSSPMEDLELKDQVAEGMKVLRAAADVIQGPRPTIDGGSQFPMICDGSNCNVAISGASLGGRETGRFMIWAKVQ